MGRSIQSVDVLHTVHASPFTPEQRIANAIVIQAAIDYINVLLGHHIPGSTQKSLEEFFVSDWYQCLTRYDGRLLMKKCQTKANELKANGILSYHLK